jgi:hypothetical protein
MKRAHWLLPLGVFLVILALSGVSHAGVASLHSGFATYQSNEGCSGDDDDDNDDNDDDNSDDDDNDDNDNDDNDDNDNDDNDDNDNDDNDDDNDAAPNYSPSVRFGVTDFDYYYDLGGYTGAVFYADQLWVASHVQLGIIGTCDDGTLQTWQQIAKDNPVGTWLNWRPPQVYYTYEATGTCAAPTIGPQYPDWATDTADFNGFLAAYPEYGDGETCFLHAQNDGQIQATWQPMGNCPIVIQQPGLDGSANGVMKAARIQTLIWDGYSWLFDMNSACAQQYTSWRTLQDIQTLGFNGEGFDNLGSPPEDGYSIPVLLDPINIMEIPADEQTSQAGLDTYWQNAVHSFLVGVRAKTVAVEPNAQFVFNGASYCSWSGSNARIAALATEGVGVWCEEALTYPVWGPFGTSDRQQTMITLSQALNAEGSYLALETFYNSGNTNPDPPETLFYLAAYYNFKNGTDAFIVRPTWSTYSPMEDCTWSDIFSRDIGSPTCDSTAGANGIFTRSYQNSQGMQTFVLVRADGTNATVDYTLTKDYCSVNSDNSLTAMPAGTISVPSGLGLILIVNGAGGVSC